MFPAYTHEMVLSMPYRLFMNGIWHGGHRGLMAARMTQQLEDEAKYGGSLPAMPQHAYELKVPKSYSSRPSVEEGKLALARMMIEKGGLPKLDG